MWACSISHSRQFHQMGCSPGATGSMHSVHPAFDSSDLQIRLQPQRTLPSPQFVHIFYHDFARLLCPPLPGRFSVPSPFDEHVIMMQSVPEAVLDHCISSSGPTVVCSSSLGTVEFHRPFAHIFLCHQAALCNSRIEHLGLGSNCPRQNLCLRPNSCAVQ